MTYLPQTLDNRRPARLRLPEVTPAVLRARDGRNIPGELQVVSMTGGLLSVPHPVNQGSEVKLIFMTGNGPVFGTAQMLPPITHSQQPFRFVSLSDSYLQRLESAIRGSLYQRSSEDWWIEKYRSAMAQSSPTAGRVSRRLVGALTFGLLSAASALYVLHLHLIR